MDFYDSEVLRSGGISFILKIEFYDILDVSNHLGQTW